MTTQYDLKRTSLKSPTVVDMMISLHGLPHKRLCINDNLETDEVSIIFEGNSSHYNTIAFDYVHTLPGYEILRQKPRRIQD